MKEKISNIIIGGDRKAKKILSGGWIFSQR